MSVSYCQYHVTTGGGAADLDIYTVGDSLLHVGGSFRFTAFSGIHTGDIEARVRILDGPPAAVEPGWDAISEATLWCPDGRLSVVGLMGEMTDALTDVAAPRGLVRVRVHARHRLHETVRTDDDPSERHELHIWAVSEATPWRTVRAEPDHHHWEQKPAAAAERAMLSLLAAQSDDTGLPRVAVVRHRPAPVRVPEGTVPVGDLAIRLRRTGDDTWSWSWTSGGDRVPSTVRVSPDGRTLRHENVPGRHAVALGLVWDHLLDAPGSYPWEAPLRARAEKAAEARRVQARHEAEKWGGALPSDRVRGLLGQARPLARMDRRLLDRLEALPADRQREVACWAARRAMRVAGLEQLGWIAEALAAADAGRPLPPLFTEAHGSAAFRRLLSDPDAPQTVVRERRRPSAIPMSQQAAAFPALLALANPDPLAAAVDAVHDAAVAHGDDAGLFLADAHAATG